MQTHWERQQRCRAKVTREPTCHSEHCKNCGKYTKTAEQKVTRGATSRIARSKKLGDSQSQTATHRSHEDRPVTAFERGNWENFTTEMQRTDACKSTNHGEHCKCTEITHYEKLSLILSPPKTPTPSCNNTSPVHEIAGPPGRR